MRHGYTNRTQRVAEGVLKSYEGPDARTRALAEYTALSRLVHVLPVPAVFARGSDGSLVTQFVPGDHGQELIDAGHASRVLESCGLLLRRLHDLDPTLLGRREAPASHVICHGDFGPNNVLFDPQDFAVTAPLDWEFCGIGPAIGDIAWCEWIVRMHHPTSVGSLAAFFHGYGERPSWEERQSVMVARCRSLGAFTRRWDPDGDGVGVWQERARITAAWTE